MESVQGSYNNGKYHCINNGIYAHSHDVSTDYVFMKNSMVLKSEKEKLISEVEKYDGVEKFLVSKKEIKMRQRTLNLIVNSKESENDKEVQYLKNMTVCEDGFIKNINTDDKGYYHSWLYVHIEVALKSYARRKWFIDTTLETNKYNKPLLLIMTKGYCNESELLAFAFLYDETTESFDDMFGRLKKILNFQPEVIICDRNAAQLKSLKSLFKSHIHFCHIHIGRNLLKYYKKNSIIYRMFMSYIHGGLKREVLIDGWLKIISENGGSLTKEDICNYYEEEIKRENGEKKAKKKIITRKK